MFRRVTRQISPTHLVRRVSTSRHHDPNAESLESDPAERSDFLEDFIRTHQPSTDDREYFRSNEHTRRFVENEAYEIVPFFSRHHIERTGENRFFAQTVNTDATIPRVLGFRRRDLCPAIKNPSCSQTADNDDSTPDVFGLLSLGPGLNAHPSIVHGGFQCVIFDEIARFLILVHQNASSRPGPRDIHFTLRMTTNYFAPVVTPADVVVRAKLIKRVGRKWFTKAEIVSERGELLTSAESLWLTARKRDVSVAT